MRCRDVMNSNVVCCDLDDTVTEAAKKMRDEDIGFLPICDTGGKVKGALTDRDIVIRAVAEGKCDARCDQVMSRDIVSCQADDDLSRALELMKDHEVSRVLVCDQDDKPVGVISLGDISYEVEDEAGDVLSDVKSGVEAHH
jgi:CBS domain-containing protein